MGHAGHTVGVDLCLVQHGALGNRGFHADQAVGLIASVGNAHIPRGSHGRAGRLGNVGVDDFDVAHGNAMGVHRMRQKQSGHKA